MGATRVNFLKYETEVVFDEEHGYYKTVPKIAVDYEEILGDFTYDTDPFSDYGIVILYKEVQCETITEGIFEMYFTQSLNPVNYSDKEREVIQDLYNMEPYQRTILYRIYEDLSKMSDEELEKIIKPRYTSE